MSDDTLNTTVDAPIAEGYTRIQASAKLNDQQVTAYFDFDFGDSAMDAIDLFGDACVHERFIRASKIEAQARIREMLTVGKSPDEVSSYMSASWKPGASSQNPEVAILGKFAEMSDEERQELIRKLQSQLG